MENAVDWSCGQIVSVFSIRKRVTARVLELYQFSSFSILKRCISVWSKNWKILRGKHSLAYPAHAVPTKGEKCARSPLQTKPPRSAFGALVHTSIYATTTFTPTTAFDPSALTSRLWYRPIPLWRPHLEFRKPHFRLRICGISHSPYSFSKPATYQVQLKIHVTSGHPKCGSVEKTI